MRVFYMLVALGMSFCILTSCSESQPREEARLIMRQMAYVNMYAPSYTTQRPLLCVEGGYYPGGTDMVFKKPGQGGELHAVFPAGVPVPSKDDLAKMLKLHGRSEVIRSTPSGSAMDKPSRLVKQIPDGYRYFVVLRWERDQ